MKLYYIKSNLKNLKIVNIKILFERYFYLTSKQSYNNISKTHNNDYRKNRL